MTVGLAIGVTVAVAVSCGVATYVYSLHHFRTLLDTAQATALHQSELIRVALEHQMMENDRSLIGEMIESFGQEAGVEHVVLVDREGRVRYSSKPLEAGAELSMDSPTCQACHQFPPDQRTSSRVIHTAGETMLRTVVPFRNREACHRCHDPNHAINGVLIVDADAGAMRATMNRDLRWLAAGSGALMLALVTGIGFVVRLVVIRRLQGFEVTARQIAGGDLTRRVSASGSDIVSWLAREFNSMADSMSGLVDEVRGQRERLETVLNSVDDGIVVLDRDREVLAANDAFIRRTGRARGDLVGESCLHVAGGMCGVTDCPTLACLHSGSVQVRICERRTESGEVAWEEVHSSPIRGPSGAVTQVVEVWRDISKRRAAEAQLAESHRLASLGLLASGFSHELNTPLATALMCVESILRTPASDHNGRRDWSGAEESARTAREQLLRCGGITQQFLRLASGKGSSQGVVDVEPTLASVARLLAPTARERSVTIEVEPVETTVHVKANEAELQQVLLNLTLNAVQASPPGARVRLGVRGTDPVRIHVSDEGCGIAPEDRKKIFEPFFSLRPEGTGLGLYLSQDFVRGWGGTIELESRPGKGSTFLIVFPNLDTKPAASTVRV